MVDVQYRVSDRVIVAAGAFPSGSPDPASIAVASISDAEAAKLGRPGVKTLAADDATVLVAPPEPPPIVYDGLRPIDAPPFRTTDDQPHEVFRFETHAQHVYRTTLRMAAIDAGNGATRDSEVRLVFKGLAASVAQVGAMAVISNAQDAAAASWRIQAVPSGTDLAIQVTGAAGRAIDWKLTGDVGVFAPAGLEG